jgi:outer membrane protein assembly factor BamB
MAFRGSWKACTWFAFTLCISLPALTTSVQADGWTRFRGPNGSGVSDQANVPLEWSETENLKWRTELPGPGFSSPIIAGGKVFVTCYSGYGLDRENPGDVANLKRHLVCADAASGQIVWSAVVESAAPEDPYKGFITEHGYASHTPATDGERVFAFFGKSGVVAFDFSGQQLWQQSVGTASGRMRWGSASSPVLHENLVIVPASDESNALVGLDKATGEEVWREQGDALAHNWSTPILADGQDGFDLVYGVRGEVRGLDPATGETRWNASGLSENGYCISMVSADGVIYCAGAMRGGESFAVRAGGKGDVTDSHVIWTGRGWDSIISPVLYEGHLFGTTNRGIAYCRDAKTGERVYQARLATGEAVTEEAAAPGGGRGRAGGRRPPQGGQDRPGGRPGGQRGGRGGRSGGPGGGEYASPILAGGRIYVATRSGVTYVVAPKPEFELLAKNSLESDTSGFCATPAVSGGSLFLRSNAHLYCVSDD